MRKLIRWYGQLNDRHPAVAVFLAVMLIVTPVVGYWADRQNQSDKVLCQTAQDTRQLIRDVIHDLVPIPPTDPDQRARVEKALARVNEPRCP